MSTKLHVANLNFTTTEDALKTAFSANGRAVRGVTMPTDRETGRPRGFAFVDMATNADATAAIAELSGKDFEGRAISVSEAREREPRSGSASRRDQ